MTPIAERRPSLPGWVPVPGAERMVRQGVWAVSAWQKGTTCVISALELAEHPDGDGVGPQWHVSISHLGKRRPTEVDLRRARRAFDLHGAEEDNHHPGVARHIWLWVPKQLIEDRDDLDDGSVTFTIPRWLAEERGLV